MKILLLVFLFLFLSNLVFPQSNYQDVIHLKNGDIIKGFIIENVPSEYILIELSGGSILTYFYKDIQKFNREKIGSVSDEKNGSAQTNIIMQQQQQQQQTAPLQIQSLNSSLTDTQKLAMYEANKKSPATARALSFLISSVGHAYAGNWGRGLLFLLGRSVFLGVAISGAEKNSTTSIKSNSDDGSAQIAVGVVGMLGFAIWEIIDAGNEVEEYNKRLYNSIYPGIPNFGMSISPMNQICNNPINDGVKLNFNYRF